MRRGQSGITDEETPCDWGALKHLKHNKDVSPCPFIMNGSVDFC